MKMQTFRIQLRKELLELWRTRKFIIVIVVLVSFGMLSPVLAQITPDLLKSMGENQMQGVTITIPTPSTKDAIDQFVKNLTQFGLLLAVLMSFGAIVGEREHGQAALIFAHPLPRTIFVWAKFSALAILFGLGIVLSSAVAYAYTVILFDPPNIAGFSALVGLIYLWLLAVIAVSLLASVLGRTIISAGGIAFLFIVFFLLGGTFTTLAPGTLNTWGHDLALTNSAPAHWGALTITLVVIVGAVGTSSILLRHQEIE
jgi:ABC-2 type transport system permease protein